MSSTPTVAVYGGSFNPPHVGHALVASWVLWTGQADAVWLLPSHSHPFGKQSAPFARRVALCDALAAQIGPEVGVCTIEAELEPPHYTFDVLTVLAERHPDRRFRLVLGADVLPELPRWHRWGELRDRFAPLVVGRQGYPSPPGAIDMPGISSTEIRRRFAAGEPVDHLVPRAVLDLVGDLYTSDPEAG